MQCKYDLKSNNILSFLYACFHSSKSLLVSSKTDMEFAKNKIRSPREGSLWYFQFALRSIAIIYHVFYCTCTHYGEYDHCDYARMCECERSAASNLDLPVCPYPYPSILRQIYKCQMQDLAGRSNTDHASAN